MTSDIRINVRTVGGLQIRVAEHVSTASRHVVLTSPWPESLLAFERAWPLLSTVGRLTAVDLPGFGRSELDVSLLTPTAMGEFLVSLLDALAIGQPHLVCPDVGTPAALYAAARHPGRIRSLVLVGGAAAYPLQVSGALQDLIDAPNIDALRGRDARELTQCLATAMGTGPPGIAAVEDYVASNDGGRFAEAARYVRSYPVQLAQLADLLPTIFCPVQIIAGSKDPLVPLGNARYLHNRLPNSRLEVLDAGHCVWEEAADEFARLVGEWVNGGYLAPPGITQG